MVECIRTWGAIVINSRTVKFVLVLALTAAIGTSVSALTWPAAVTLLKANNNELRSAQQALAASSWTYRRSYGALLPQLSANLSAGSTGVASGAATASYSYGLSASLDLFNASDYYGLRSAYADYQYNQADYDLTAASVLYEVRLAFIDLLIAQARVDLQKKILARRQENSRLIELRYNSGNENRGNLLRTQADEANARYNLSSAERDLRLARLDLSQLLGTTVATAEEEFTFNESARPDYETLLSASPSYRTARYQLESSEIQQQATLGEFLPSVTLAGSYRRSGSSWPPGADSNSLSMSVSLPLFPGGTNWVDKAINDIKLDKAKEDFAKAVKDARFSIASGYENLADALEALAVARTVLDATTERSNIAQEKYINGLMTYDAWDIIENEYISSQASYLNSRKNVLTADAAWQKSFGGYVENEK
jgi:outer membrane protein TolC